ncbi:DinB family protein [Chryseobacterium shigense]|uniref:DinB-like domain-containing protein n=1 Tax=Chryseobacterium shigense TaxID=297244 RepID=A0A841MYH8_9FLAO|nr:DinB family protein [Chryseobacterium shigense]MBB6369604.1 hypothetical protein [Chryseobacterium shigense]
MEISTSQLLNELKILTQEHMQYAESLLKQPDEKLNFRLSQDSWSILECLEHLNRYGNFYIPEISQRISAAKTSPVAVFKPGIIGNYFTESMRPKEKLNKMKAFKSMNPVNSRLNKNIVHEFIRQQEQMTELLGKAENVNVNTVKTNISITKLVKLKLGDTFRFVIYHNARHIRQAENIIVNI